ncbi:hypothetical protein [Mycolicibacterium sp. 120270]|uniref:hypothetical protein n=1 Tax=Mycolicibacterium sp. 120270 TaxID=3090600 RepID=UPI00299DD6BA|nr:hypothetical protein [Mycolicibacterium sp. 120270]MDX1885391.1 hypothetical protein [Mycolicibacterium sp. 120270]
MGRHSVAQRRRIAPSVAPAAAVIAPYALLLAAGGDVSAPAPVSQASAADQPVDDGRSVEVVASAPTALAAAPASLESAGGPDQVQFATASRYRVYDREAERVLRPGIAPERGLQVKTILVARSISALFPEIQNIGGVRPDSLRWHPNGLALDVMIPNPTSAAGIALGNRIVAFALENADRFDLQDCIWRGQYFTPNGVKAGGYGHYDHVHITTHGGGYPTGDEVYLR